MEFYGYKRCSTCRNAHKYLAEHGVELEFHDFVNHPPTREQLQRWISIRGEGVEPFINTRGTRYRELGLKDKTLSEADWLDMLSQDGKLLKRPIVVTDDEIVIGFDKSAYDRLVEERA
jgi:arsenate reductase